MAEDPPETPNYGFPLMSQATDDYVDLWHLILEDGSEETTNGGLIVPLDSILGSIEADLDATASDFSSHESSTSAHGANGDVAGMNDLHDRYTDGEARGAVREDVDASELGGGQGSASQVLTTDGTNLSWETPGAADLRFGMFPMEVDPETRDDFYSDFGKFAESYAVMNTIVRYETVMDEVSASSTAMDAVSTSSTAMDAVSTSSTAMDAVSTSLLARTSALLSSYYNYIWREDVWSESFWNNVGSYSGNANDSLIDSPNEAGWAVGFFSSGKSSARQLEFTLDLSDASTLELWQKNDHEGTNWVAVVEIGGSKVLDDSGTTSWTERTFDVSSETGETTIVLRGEDQYGYSNPGRGPAGFGELRLIE